MGVRARNLEVQYWVGQLNAADDDEKKEKKGICLLSASVRLLVPVYHETTRLFDTFVF